MVDHENLVLRARVNFEQKKTENKTNKPTKIEEKKQYMNYVAGLF